MGPSLQEFLAAQELGVLTVLLSGNIPHSATVHYSYDTELTILYIQTLDTTVKAQPFLNGETGKGSFVVGVSKQEWKTAQMRGEVRLLSDPATLERAYQVHYAKHPGMEQRKGPHTIMLQFSPTWWRYTDSTTKPETILASQ